MKWFLALGCAVFLTIGVRAADETSAANAKTPEEIVAQLDGKVLPRPGGGWIQLNMEGVSLVVRFYDEKARPVPPDVDRGVARFVFRDRKEERRVLVTITGGDELSHGRPIRPPHIFKLFLSFYRGDSSDAVESYTADFP